MKKNLISLSLLVTILLGGNSNLLNQVSKINGENNYKSENSISMQVKSVQTSDDPGDVEPR